MSWSVTGILLMGSIAAVTTAQALAQATPSANPAATPPSAAGKYDALERTRPFAVADKHTYFTNLQDGDKVRSPFRVAFSVSGMGVSPVKAGEIEGTGHHHILIDRPLPVDIKAPIPFDKADEFKNQHYKHFGKGETEAVLDLPPGKHTLQLLFADHRHVPYYIKSKVITIEVVK